MKKTYAFLATLLLASGVAAQNPTAYFMEGTTFRSQFNPAFAPLRGYVNIPGLGGIDINASGNLAVDKLLYPRNGKLVALLDEAKLSYPLKVRRWSEGDAFVPFGMGGRRKKVSDMLIDDKVSLPDKRRQFVVVSGGDIVWLVGRRIDERYAVGSGTENVLRIRILPDDDL